MRFFQKIKNWKTVRGWHIWKLKLVDARLYFVSMIVGLLTGLIAVCYHYLLYFLLHIRSDFFASRPAWYWHILLFLLFWGILMFVSFLVGRMPLISGGGIPQTRGVINGRITYKHPFVELVSKFAGGILSVAAGLSLGREPDRKSRSWAPRAQAKPQSPTSSTVFTTSRTAKSVTTESISIKSIKRGRWFATVLSQVKCQCSTLTALLLSQLSMAQTVL